MNKIKAILFDIDDTLYSHKSGKIPSLTMKTIQALKEKGYILGLCTSRFPEEFYSLPTHEFKWFDMIIAGTGAIYLKDDEILHTEKIKTDVSKRFIEYLDQNPNINYCWIPVTGESHFSSRPVDHIYKHHENWSGKCPSIQKWNGEDLICIIYYEATDKQTEEIVQMVDKDGIERWGNCGHINPKGVNKAYGIEYFRKYFHLEDDEIMCFGDGQNDISMIEKAGIGVAVGNAREELKKHADYVCGDIDQGGIYDICVELGLIEPINSKIFFFDIDGTTYSHQTKIVPESTSYALKKLKEKGNKICICTSRSSDEMINLPEEFLNLFDSTICLAGGYITIENEKLIHLLDKQEMKNAIQHLDEMHVPYRYVTADNKGYLYNSTEFVRGLFDFQYQMIPPEKAYEDEELIHFQYYPLNEKQNEEIIQFFKISKLTHLKYSHEVTQENLDKASAIQIVAQHYGYNRENTVAFGDGFNDVTMLESAYIGIAMGNGSNACKAASDYITDGIDEDGLYHACVHFKWI